MKSKFSSHEIWRHNSYLGHVAMARRNLLTIASAPTVTPESVRLAEEILPLAEALAKSLKTRKEQR